MKKIYFALLTTALVWSGKAQTVLLDENFESYQDFTINSFGAWTTLDLDQLFTYSGTPEGTWPHAGEKMAYQIFNPSTANIQPDPEGIEVPNYTPHSGNKYAGSWAGAMVASGQGNNDWLITPAVTLGTSGNSISMWVKSVFDGYGQERYRIGVYVGSGNPTSEGDITIISTAPFLLAPQTSVGWQQKTFDLNSFSGQTVRIGIQCITQDAYMFAVDDVKVVTSSALSTQEFQKAKFSVYPVQNDGEFEINSDKKINHVSVMDLSGKVIKSLQKKDISIVEAPPGIYILKVLYEDGTFETGKIIRK